jgi:flagellar hook-associated protein 3 FlgL
MRVATNTFSNSLTGQLGSLSSSQSKLQLQVSSGQRMTVSEDDPVAMRQVLNMQTEARSVSQYKSNVANQQELATANYTVIKSLNNVSSRVNEIATLADGLKSQDDLTNYATEVNQLIQQTVQWANTKHGDSYLFGGTKNDQAPFSMETDADGKVTAVNYSGNESTNMAEISEGVTLTTQITGNNTTGVGAHGLFSDTTTGADFFNHLISLRDNLSSGNIAGIVQNDIPSLRKDEDNFIYHVGLNGVVQSRLESTMTTLKDRSQSLNSQVSNEAGTEMAQTAVRLTQTQTAYQAALQSSSKILSMSLVDYIK